MNHQREKNISLKEANKIIQEFQKTSPVDIYGLAERLGLKIYETGMYPQNISGAIIKNPKDETYKIVINNKHSGFRQRFTIAHEFAHFILHKKEIGSGIQDDVLFRSGLSGNLEIEANNFAANILMPWHLIEEALEDGADTIHKLAEKLWVSKSAMSVRLGVPY